LSLTRSIAFDPRRPGGALAFAARAADALGAEAVGRRFFRRFQAVLESMTRHCPARARPRSGMPGRCSAHASALLYFIQSKGWLDGCSDFLARE